MAQTKYLSLDGLYYLWSLLKARLDNKQTVITDLDTIRANALAGSELVNNVYTKAQIDAKLTSAMHYKGSVATYADLPSSNVTVGDFYNVLATGANYAWTGSDWDETGTVVDLSTYVQTTDLVAVTNTEIDTVLAS